MAARTGVMYRRPAMLSVAPHEHETPPGWCAGISLGFEVSRERTVLRRAAHSGPLRVQRAFYPEPGATLPHVYLLHPPGGIVGGDALAIDVAVARDAAALVTTPAAGKLYRNRARWARHDVRCRIARGASLEWLPQETIAFSGCHARTSLAVDVAEGGGFLGWEILALGRAACGESFTEGVVDQRVRVTRAGRPRLVERARIAAADGEDGLIGASWGLRGAAASGTMVAVAPGDPAALDAGEARAAIAAPACGGAAAVTLVEPDVLVARYLGPSAAGARAVFERLRGVIRPAWLGRAAIAPRIWAT